MKQKLVRLIDKILLRKGSLIETVYDQLKNMVVLQKVVEDRKFLAKHLYQQKMHRSF